MKLVKELSGIGPVTVKKLNDNGIYTVRDAVRAGPMGLVMASGRTLDEAVAVKAVLEAQQMLEEENQIAPTIQTGKEIAIRRQNLEKLTTGCPDIDEILLGGIEVGASMEVYGDFDAGKSQLMHTIMVTCQLPKDKGGLDGRVLIIDSENTFRPERIREIVIRRELVSLKEQSKEDRKAGILAEPENEEDVTKFLENITVAKPQNAGHQHWMIEHLGEFIKDDEEHPIRLVIIDSLTKLFRGEYLGRSYLGARQIALNEHVTMLTKIPDLYNIAVVWTNQVLDDPSITFGDPVKPVGGHIVGHASTYRLYLKKSGKKRICIIKDSPLHAPNEVEYSVTGAGIVNKVSD